MLCMLVLVLQSLVGIPLTSIVSRREAKRFISSGDYKGINQTENTKIIKVNKKSIPELPPKYRKSTIILAKLGLVTMLGYALSNLTNEVSEGIGENEEMKSSIDEAKKAGKITLTHSHGTTGIKNGVSPDGPRKYELVAKPHTEVVMRDYKKGVNYYQFE